MERRSTSRRELGPYRRYELLTGTAVYPARDYTGYGDGENPNMEDFISDEMKRDWIAHRNELIAFWQSGGGSCGRPWLFAVHHSSDKLPWAAKIFDRDGGDPKAERSAPEFRPIA
jgi:hypothetical protein